MDDPPGLERQITVVHISPSPSSPCPFFSRLALAVDGGASGTPSYLPGPVAAMPWRGRSHICMIRDGNLDGPRRHASDGVIHRCPATACPCRPRPLHALLTSPPHSPERAQSMSAHVRRWRFVLDTRCERLAPAAAPVTTAAAAAAGRVSLLSFLLSFCPDLTSGGGFAGRPTCRCRQCFLRSAKRPPAPHVTVRPSKLPRRAGAVSSTHGPDGSLGGGAYGAPAPPMISFDY